VRVVGGSLRGRRLLAPADERVRPTSDRAREALFNILTQGRHGNVVAEAEVLDAFAGSGALGIEALSRGAALVTFLEQDRDALLLIRSNLRALRLVDRAAVLAVDAMRPPAARRPVSLALLDPPYGSGFGAAALAQLKAAGWFAPGALISLEMAKAEDVVVPEGFELLDERRYGKAKLLLLRSD